MVYRAPKITLLLSLLNRDQYCTSHKYTCITHCPLPTATAHRVLTVQITHSITHCASLLFPKMSTSFISQADSLDVSESFVVVGLSNLEGNIWDGGVKLLSIENGEELQSKHCECGISMIRFAGQNKNFVLTARDDGNVALYSSSTLDDLLLLPAHDDYVSCVAVHGSNETEFVSCGWDGAIKIWDWQSANKDTPTLSITGAHYKHVNEISINPLESPLLASVGQDGFLRIWDRRTDINAEGCAQIHNLHQAGACVTWDVNRCNFLYAGTDAGDVAAFDLRVSGGDTSAGECFKEQRVHKGRVRRLSTVSGHPGMLVSCSDDTTIAVSSVRGGAGEAPADCLFDELER